MLTRIKVRWDIKNRENKEVKGRGLKLGKKKMENKEVKGDG